jgi:hypothetical protein
MKKRVCTECGKTMKFMKGNVISSSNLWSKMVVSIEVISID